VAKVVKRKVAPGTSGRVTPKGGRVAPGKKTPEATGRYTPPIPREMRVSPTWIPVLMFGLLLLGTAVILLNYVALLPDWGILPDDTSNTWLLIGLAMILAGIVVATQWH
jgi:hypothetical protein